MKTNKGALQRLDEVEEKIQRILYIMSQGFGTLEGRVGSLDEVLTAVVNCVGREPVTEKIKEMRKARFEAEVSKQKDVLGKAVELGIVSKIDQISEESLIIGKENDKDGNPTSDFVEILYSTLLPEFQEKLLLKTVGTVVETPAKGTFEVLEVYQPKAGLDLAETTLEEQVSAMEAASASEKAQDTQASTEPVTVEG